MHRFIRRTVLAAALAVTASPLSAQFLFDPGPGTAGAFIGNRGGIGQFMRVTTTTNVTRLGFELGVVAPGTQTFVAYIASATAPATRLWEQTFVRTLAVVPDAVRNLFLTDPLSFQLNAGTDYLLGFYSTSGPAGWGWVGKVGIHSQNGLAHLRSQELDVDGRLLPRDFVSQFNILIEGTQTITPPPPPVGVIPEPSTYALMATGLAGVAALQRRRRRIAAATS